MTEKKIITYKVLKNRNFVGFLDPITRKFLTAEKGKIEIRADNEKAIAILDNAADLERE